MSSLSRLGAQNTSELGRFSLEFVQGCAPFIVEVDELIPFAETFYNYGDSIVSETTFTFETPGTYSVIQLIQEDDLPDGKIDSLVIEVFEPQTPEFNIFTCQGNQLSVEITDDYYSFYEASLPDGQVLRLEPLQQSDFVPVTFTGNNTVTVQGFFEGGSPSCESSTMDFEPLAALRAGEITELRVVNDTLITVGYNLGPNADYRLERSLDGLEFEEVLELPFGEDRLDIAEFEVSGTPCYRIVTNDGCDGSLIPSDVECLIDLQVDNDLDGNLITMITHPSVDISGLNLFKDDALLNAGRLVVADPDLTCNIENCYRADMGVSVSNTICLVPGPLNNLPPPDNFQSTIMDGEIRITWDSIIDIPVSEYRITGDINTSFRSDGTQHMLDLNLRRNPPMIQLSYRDECSNQSRVSNSTTPIFLFETTNDGSPTLNWSRYFGWEEGIRHYYLQQLQEDGTWENVRLILSGRDLEIDEEIESGTFRIAAESLSEEPRFSYSNTIRIVQRSFLVVPTAFTPDGDGLNDTFFPLGRNIDRFQMFIFNRWGEIIFESDNIENGWNGVYQGRKVPQGNYTYKIEFGSEDGGNSVQTGSFVLFRN